MLIAATFVLFTVVMLAITVFGYYRFVQPPPVDSQLGVPLLAAGRKRIFHMPDRETALALLRKLGHWVPAGKEAASTAGLPSYKIARLGLGYVPENRDIFPKLTVHQNLELGRKGGARNSRWSFDDMYGLFPRLKERQHTEAGVLSGGEQQMLTLCRTLMGDPDLIIIDEPTEGLAPKIVELVGEYLKKLKDRGISVLLIEQKLTIAMAISDRALVMGHGSIVFEGTPQSLREDAYTRKEWLEV